MNDAGIRGMIRTQPDRQTGALGEALKAKLAEQPTHEEPNVTLTLRPSPHSNRILFTLEEDFGQQGNSLRSGIFYGSTHAAEFVSQLLTKHPTATVIRKELPA